MDLPIESCGYNDVSSVLCVHHAYALLQRLYICSKMMFRTCVYHSALSVCMYCRVMMFGPTAESVEADETDYLWARDKRLDEHSLVSLIWTISVQPRNIVVSLYINSFANWLKDVFWVYVFYDVYSYQSAIGQHPSIWS